MIVRKSLKYSMNFLFLEMFQSLYILSFSLKWRSFLKKPNIPNDEVRRLKCLLSMNILDTKPEERFDRLTRIAQKHFNVPVALVSLIDTNRQWFKSNQGLDASETPREIAFCAHAILSKNILYISDALEDQRFADNPLVIGPPNIRFYAGAPLSGSDGSLVGTLCIIDFKTRDFTVDELTVLRDLADCVQAELQLSDMKELNIKLVEKETFLSAIVNNIDDAVVVVDDDCKILTFNQASNDIFATKLEAADSINIAQFIDPKEKKKFNDVFDNYKLNCKSQASIVVIEKIGSIKGDKSKTQLRVIFKSLQMEDKIVYVIIIQDLTLQSAKRLAEEKYSAIVMGSFDAIISKDLNGIITTWNKAAEDIFGYTAEEAIGLPMHTLIPEDILAQEPDIIPRIKAGERIENFDTVRIKKNGERINISATISPIRDYDDNIIGASQVIRDITDRVLLEKQKSEFISTVSHELRTPLTSIKGSIGLIKSTAEDSLPEKTRRLLNIAYNNSERLVILINEILDFEKISAGKLEYNLEPLDMKNLVEGVIADSKGYEIECGIKYVLTHADPDSYVYADKNRIIQVLSNLMSNAAKFSPKNSEVRLRVDIRGNSLRVSVTDSGYGVPKEFRENIFKRFSQADSTDTRKVTGTGLGLSISKAIIEGLDGTIGFSSEGTGGSTFYFDLPLYNKYGEINPAKIVAKSTSPRALICEDDTDIIDMLKLILTEEGFEVDVAQTSEQAFNKIIHHKYTVMTLDLGLPDRDGISLLKELHSSHVADNLPIIIISGKKSGKKSERLSELKGGAFMIADWIEKPLDFKRLAATLKKVVDKSIKHKPDILYVEDDIEVVGLVSEIVHSFANIVPAKTLADAKYMMTQRTFGLIILDLMLPDGSGEELLEFLKQAGIPSPPVIIFSARDYQGTGKDNIVARLLKSTISNKKLRDLIRSSILDH